MAADGSDIVRATLEMEIQAIDSPSEVRGLHQAQLTRFAMLGEALAAFQADLDAFLRRGNVSRARLVSRRQSRAPAQRGGLPTVRATMALAVAGTRRVAAYRHRAIAAAALDRAAITGGLAVAVRRPGPSKRSDSFSRLPQIVNAGCYGHRNQWTSEPSGHGPMAAPTIPREGGRVNTPLRLGSRPGLESSPSPRRRPLSGDRGADRRRQWRPKRPSWRVRPPSGYGTAAVAVAARGNPVANACATVWATMAGPERTRDRCPPGDRDDAPAFDLIGQQSAALRWVFGQRARRRAQQAAAAGTQRTMDRPANDSR